MKSDKKTTAVIGHFAFGKECADGQTVKTKIITEALCERFGDSEILRFDTEGGKKTLLKAPFQVLRALKRAKNVTIFPAHNGIRVYVPLLSFFRHFFRGRRLHYVVIGGWLPSLLQKRKNLAGQLKRFDGIYVETATMKKALEAQGFANVSVVPNCKKLRVLSSDELLHPMAEPYPLCTFSRVMKQKGIEDAVDAVCAVNKAVGRTAYSLDIYGKVDPEETAWFEDLKATFPPFVRYRGIVDYNGSVEVLKAYFALLFPTRFYTEGIPGTVLDAYAAGVPVISARWESFFDLVKENVTGIGYGFNQREELETILSELLEKPERIDKMRENCLQQAKKYTPEEAIKEISERF